MNDRKALANSISHLVLPLVAMAALGACSSSESGNPSSPGENPSSGGTAGGGKASSAGNGGTQGTVGGRSSASGASASGGNSAGSLGNGGQGGATATGGTLTPVATGPYLWKSVRTGASGGFIVDVVFNPKQKDLIYAKTDMGGVYRWNPGDGTWTQLMNWVGAEQWGLTGAEAIATDPVDPNRLYIAGGTYTNSWDPNNGAILRSTDKGETFEITPMPFKMGGNMPGRGMGERLAVDPNQNSILYFGAREEKGLWKSIDSGVTWNKVENFPDLGPYAQDPNDTTSDYLNHSIGIPWVVFDPASGTAGSPSKTIYVGVAQNASGKPNLYRSTDAGATWEPVPGQPTCTAAGNIVSCTGGATWDMSKKGDDGTLQWTTTGYLPHQGKLDSNGTLYVTYSNFAGPYNGNVGDVWKFEPSSATWTMISPIPGSKAPTDLWWGYGGLAVDLQHPGTLVVSTVNSWWPEGNLFRTTDGGKSWIAGWEWNGYPNRTIRWTMDISTAPWLNLGVTKPVPPDPAIKVGWMMEGMAIDPFNSERMMYGTGATLYGTTDLTNWDKGKPFTIKNMAVGMEETSVLGLVSPPTGTAHLFSVVGDVGGWRHDELDVAPSVSYVVPYSGTNNDIDFAEGKPEFLVRVGTGKSTASPAYHGSAFTFDSGKTWFQGNSDPAADKGGGTVAAAADASRVVWASSDSSVPVSYSTDNGNAWKPSANIPNGAVVASDRVNATKFYGLGGGKFWVSTDGGATFTASAAPGLPTSGKIKAVFGKEGEVWLSGGSQGNGGSTTCSECGLWRTIDSGATFTKVSGVSKAEAIGFGKGKTDGAPPAVFISGIVGDVHAVFRSDDSGAQWTKITDDKHQFATIQTLTGDPRIHGRVYLGTNGLGILYGDLAVK